MHLHKGLFAGALLSLVSAAPGAAQSLQVDGTGAIRIECVTIEAIVEEGVARVTVDETFRNTTAAEQEGIYSFRLPEDAVIGAFSMWMAGKEMHGRVLEAVQARATYDAIVRKRRDPGLLEQTGWRDFRVNVFPIPAHDVVRVKLVYSHVVRDDLGLQSLVIPLPQDCGAVGDLRVRASFRTTPGFAGIDCPSHPAAMLTVDGDGAEACWSGDGVTPAGPFVVRAIPRRDGFGVTLLASRAPGDDHGWFIARVVPNLAEPPPIARDVVFVFDRSGSMEGKKIEQARAALVAGLETLAPGDRFEVVSFSSDVTPLGKSGLLAATSENLALARKAARDLTASGGTNIHGALQAALKLQKPDAKRLSAIVFLTDGAPTVGEQNPDRILAAWRKECRTTRLFAFGVGNDVKDFLLSKLAVEGRGEARYVREDENLEVPLSALFDRVKTPLLLDPVVDVEGEGVEITDREPRRLPDLFQGRALVVAGRFKGAGKAVIRLRGRSAANDVAVDVPVTFPAGIPERSHVAQIWAKSRVERLLDDMRVHGSNEEIRTEIRTLGLAHQLVTPFTSFLVLEEGAKVVDARGDAAARDPQVADEGSAFNGMPPGDSTPPGNPGGPATPSPVTGSGNGGFFRGTPTGAAPTTGGAGATTRVPPAGATRRGSSSEGFERWEFWWEHNKEPFLREVRLATAGSPRSAIDVSELVPALLTALENPEPDVADAAALALARTTNARDAATILPALTKALAHPQRSVRESATLALGVLGAPEGGELLRELLADSEAGRRLTGQRNGVEALTRALAAAGLGMLGDASAVDLLERIVRDPDRATLDGVRAMALLALGMMRDRHEQIVPFLLGVMTDRSLAGMVRAQAPIALGKLNRDGSSAAARQALHSTVLDLFQDAQIDQDLRRSLAICIGSLASAGDDAAIDALAAAVDRSSDEQTRHFSIMALARIGARDDEPAAHAAAHAKLLDLLLRELTQPKRIAHQPFGALGLGVYARNEKLAPETRTLAATRLLQALDSTGNPSYRGAMAIALGLLGWNAATEEIERNFEESHDPPLKGYAAIALAMLHAAPKTEWMRQMLSTEGLEPRTRLQMARALGLHADRAATPVLIGCLQGAGTIVESAAAAQALGMCGDSRAVQPLLDLLKDPKQAALRRGLAAVALGLLAEKSALPWTSDFSIDVNYRAKVDALAEILDLL